MRKRLSGIVIVTMMLCVAACGKNTGESSGLPVNDTAVSVSESEETQSEEMQSEETQSTESVAGAREYISIEDKMKMKIEELLNSDTEKIPQEEITLSYQGNSVVVHKYDMDMNEIIQLLDAEGSSEALSIEKNEDGFIRFIRFVDPSKNIFLLENKFTSKDLTEIAVDHLSLSSYGSNTTDSIMINGVVLGSSVDDVIAVLGKPDSGTTRKSSLCYMYLKWFYELDGKEVELRLEFIEGGNGGIYTLNNIAVYFYI